ncbi:MAG: hypothetical protein WEB89_04740 [Balneolales bacterium]
MAYHSGEKLLIAATASFLGGAMIGMMLGKDNRDWVTENAGELAQRLNEMAQEARKRSTDGLQDIKKNAGNVKDMAPDLVQATKETLQRGR